MNSIINSLINLLYYIQQILIMCNHNTCRDFRQKRVTGIAVVIVVFYGKPNSNSPRQTAVGLIKERFGPYAGTYSLVAGRQEPQDGGCYLVTLMRELREEAKITITSWDQFNAAFKRNNKLKYVWQNNTPVFVGNFNGLSRAQINPKIFADNNNPNKLMSEKETSHFEYFFVNNGFFTPENARHPISSFATNVCVGNINLINEMIN